jgi:hypothetical protein
MASTNYQLGENGHIEIGWYLEDIQEGIVQFQFQCVRCSSPEQLLNLENVLNSLLTSIQKNIDETRARGEPLDVIKNYLRRLYQLIGITRDIQGGKGERDLAYMMIYVWYRFYPSLAFFALDSFVFGSALCPEGSEGLEGSEGSNADIIPFGSWKDIKRMCSWVFNQVNDMTHPLIGYAVDLMCKQLKIDAAVSDDSRLSLVARWVPRESSKKNCWIFRLLAVKYIPEYIATAKTRESRDRAVKKTYMTFARLIVSLNKRLDTVQIKMCGKRWADINPHNVPSVALLKNRAAFFCKGSTDPDRIMCAENFTKYVADRVESGKSIKGGNVGIVDYVKDALKCVILDEIAGPEANMLNAQWSDFVSKVGNVGNMVAMVDQSASMTWEGGNAYYAALGLGMTIASKSLLGPRFMTFSSDPSWVSLEGYDTFLKSISFIREQDCLSGGGTNFFKALDLLLSTCIKEKVSDEVVSGMTLVIFSDMQIDCGTNRCSDMVEEEETRWASEEFFNEKARQDAFSKDMDTMHDKILKKYNAAGYSVVPHLIFWNLRNTQGFPTSSLIPGATMFSGFSPLLLNSFCQEGRDALVGFTPWDSLCCLLDGARYMSMGDRVEELFVEEVVEEVLVVDEIREEWGPGEGLV